MQNTGKIKMLNVGKLKCQCYQLVNKVCGCVSLWRTDRQI